ncbi:unnamed protein product [Chrysoparadoxa australica]
MRAVALFLAVLCAILQFTSGSLRASAPTEERTLTEDRALYGSGSSMSGSGGYGGYGGGWGGGGYGGWGGGYGGGYGGYGAGRAGYAGGRARAHSYGYNVKMVHAKGYGKKYDSWKKHGGRKYYGGKYRRGWGGRGWGGWGGKW